MSLLDIARAAIAKQAAEGHLDQVRYRWRVTDRERGSSMEVCFLPELTWHQVADRYPGADVEPLLADD